VFCTFTPSLTEELFLLRSIGVGTIPTTIGQLTKLEALFIQFTAFHGTLPVEMGNLTSLEQLHIENNRFSGTVPTEIGNLPNLGKFCRGALNLQRRQELTTNIPAVFSQKHSTLDATIWRARSTTCAMSTTSSTIASSAAVAARRIARTAATTSTAAVVRGRKPTETTPVAGESLKTRRPMSTRELTKLESLCGAE